MVEKVIAKALPTCPNCGQRFFTDEAYRAHRVPSKWFQHRWIKVIGEVYDPETKAMAVGWLTDNNALRQRFLNESPKYRAGWPDHAFDHISIKKFVMCITNPALDYGPAGGAA